MRHTHQATDRPTYLEDRHGGLLPVLCPLRPSTSCCDLLSLRRRPRVFSLLTVFRETEYTTLPFKSPTRGNSGSCFVPLEAVCVCVCVCACACGAFVMY
jgi:hypothetical protein